MKEVLEEWKTKHVKDINITTWIIFCIWAAKLCHKWTDVYEI